MSNTWREEIPIRKAIIAVVRHRVGKNIKGWAAIIGINRGLLYQAADGDGTRRSALAVVLRQLPSELWPNRSNTVKARDNAAYLTEIGRDIVEREAQQ